MISSNLYNWSGHQIKILSRVHARLRDMATLRNGFKNLMLTYVSSAHHSIRKPLKHIGDAEIPGVLANILQYHGMDCISDNNCMQLWANKGYDMKINSRHQCADRNGVSPCSGDSGSPLTKVNNKGVTVLVGNFAAIKRG